MDEDGDTDSEVEEYSGMEQPPLIKQLKTILAEYPDDGQIIKELVQNAEDAVASEMKILYDGRTINTTSAKKLPYRKFFKAPALCFYNNAVFSDNDWRGIKMIYSSVKEEDPLKVGRFGLGFKSVFHITDNPCIISGSKILLMNPHEKVPDKVCISIKLKDLKKSKRMKVEEFEDALLGTFGFTANTLKTGNYDGTIFWFPLRETPSELSDTIYDRDKVLDLFKSFQTEAVHSLLFLKSLCKIELFCRGSETVFDLPEGQEFFSVELHDSNNTVKNARAMFLREIKDTSGNIPNNDIVCIVQPRFETRFRTAGVVAVEATRSSWLVINVYKGGEMSERLRHLVSDKDLSYSPYVGTAVLLDNCSEPFKGHVFCFLPLPQEKKSLTGLPVHFNGFFALSQNRRHLKWATADQETFHMHRDKAIEWNECLVNEVLPQVYMRLIKEMITISGTHGNNGTSVENVYKCIPDKSVVDDKWLGCVESLYEKLLHTEIVFVRNHSKWVQPLQPLYTMFYEQNVSCDTKDIVIDTVNHSRTVEATIVPIHVWEWVRKTDNARDITPAELSKILRLEDAYKTVLTPVKKMRLLQYIIKSNEFELLKGLDLLPLETGSFVTFQGQGSSPATVFMCTKEEVSLFLGMEKRFVSTGIPLTLKEALHTLADLEKFQIRLMTIKDTINLLETILLQEIGNGDPITLRVSQNSRFANWIEKIWIYIMDHYPKSISQFSHVPLIPCLSSGRWDDGTWKNADIHLYTMKHTFMLKSGKGIEELPHGVSQALEYFYIVILPSLPEWFPVEKFSCIITPTAKGLSELFEKLNSSNTKIIDCFNSNSKASDAEALIEFLDRITCSFTDKAVAFLQQLRLFRQSTSFMDMPTMLTAIRENNQIANFSDSIPVRFPRPLLIRSSHSSLRFAIKLRATEINEDTLVDEFLQAINRGSYSSDDVREFMTWFLTNIYKFQSYADIISRAKNVAFVPNGHALCKPSELYDPRDIQLQVLFQEESKFPVAEFTSDIYLNNMAQLGLKKKQDLSANCLYTTAKELDRMCRNDGSIECMSKKANALFQLLEEKPDILKTYVPLTKSQLQESLGHLKCIPHERERPRGYPNDLVWKGSEYILCAPAELTMETFTNTVGSVIPLVRASHKLCQLFQWNKNPGVKELTEQLETIINAYSDANKSSLLPLISDVYKAMAEQCSEVMNCPEFQRLLQSKSVWCGDGFCLPSQIILESRNSDIDLRPYIYPVPVELKPVQSFLTKIGCHPMQDTCVLLSVQGMIAKKHQTPNFNDENETRKDLHIVLQLLSKLFHEKEKVTLMDEKLLFPVHTSGTGRLAFKPYTECTYCDAQWLKELAEDDGEQEEVIMYVHGDVPLTIAEGLGVQSLKQQLISDAEGLEEWGQEEPLTRRLHTLLKDGYIDGLSVPKELIQNADDAGATTMQFLYDERENMDARTQLLDEEMAGCQGPALWAYNDALFSNDDLRNITKLSGATKETDTTKIGKFGLGFCSVYNLTDVPSFISGKNIVLFDPHTKYLNKALQGNSPGLKINLQTMKNRKLMKRMQNQFKPFQGVFGCDLQQREPSFKGTLFRFPLRTNQQAFDSEIRNTSYTKDEMITLLKQFVEAAGNLLLFTQNVREIKLFHCSAGVSPDEARLLCSVNRQQTTPSLRKSVLDTCSDMKINESLRTNPFTAIQQLSITVKCENHENILGTVKSGSWQTNWLVSWATGNSTSLQLSYDTNIKGVLPLGSVALLIDIDDGRLMPRSLQNVPFGFYKTGHIFCFLPLPIELQLDIHLNGSFAVMSNRRGLQTNIEDDKYSYESLWNDALLSDAVALAFVNLLCSINTPTKLISPNVSPAYKFYQAWPVIASEATSKLKEGFYTKIVTLNSTVFESYGNWLGFKQCMFLGRSMVHDPAIRTMAVTVLQKFRLHSALSVVDLPDIYYDELQRIKGWEEDAFIVERDEFFITYFFQNIKSTYWEENNENLACRDKLVLYCLEHSSDQLDEKLKLAECIPTKPNLTLRKPQELVHPYCSISHMFSTCDERFPDSSFENIATLGKLVDLGMMKESLEPELVVERATTISVLQAGEGTAAAVARCTHLLAYLSEKRHIIRRDTVQKLKEISFLPVLEKPKNWPFRWKSEDTTTRNETEENTELVRFERPENLFLGNCKPLVACEEHILDSQRITSSEIHSDTFETLGVKSYAQVSVKTVVNQLLEVCTQSDNLAETCKKETIDDLLSEIYHFLDKAVAADPETMRSSLSVLRDKPVIYLGSEFIPASKVAFSGGYKCWPELYEIGRDRIKRYKRFLECIGVKDRFEIGNVVQVITKKMTYFQDTVLPQDEFELVLGLLRCLIDLMDLTNVSYEDLVERHGKENLIAPDSSRIIRPTFMLCFDDNSYVEAMASMRFIHSDVSRSEAVKLGVLTKKRRHLEDCSIEIPFEQKEALTTRLERLLDGYPYGIAILKELIQNADDAMATKIHFLKDLRSHPCDKIFDETFSEFQGPALCVFNDSCFTQADLIGIQKLGVGSKSEDPAKTGQYGVGFNAVYSITDSPSFLTKGPEIEGGETLCILDPLQKHSRGRVGTRYVDMTAIRTSYPDILAGYNEDVFFPSAQSTGTVFRFPLRLSKSEICSNIVSTEDLVSLFISLKIELAEILLFLKSVSEISVSTVSKEGLKTERSLSVYLSDEDKKERDVIFSQIKLLGCKQREISTSLFTFEPVQVGYQVTTRDNLGSNERWYVVHRVGLCGNDVPSSVETAVREGRLGMLPIGGIAVRMPERKVALSIAHKWESTISGTTVSKYKRTSRAYCFLPLPGTTGLPVHVNGHFILDHEVRRGLWKNDQHDEFKSKWNQLLLQNILPSAYIEALRFIRSQHLFQDESVMLTYSEVVENLMTLESFFPLAKEAEDSYWKVLARNVLETIIFTEEALFPVTQEHISDGNNKVYKIHFDSFRQQGHTYPVYFTRTGIAKSIQDPLLNLLRAVGMKITCFSVELQKSFEDCKIPINILKSESVIRFLKSFPSREIDSAKIDHIPCKVEETVLKTIDNVNAVLDFCSKCESFESELCGSPLLVTNDCVLRCFDTNTPVYCSKFAKLFPNSADTFVHEKQISTLRNIGIDESSLSSELQIQNVADLLPSQLETQRFARHDTTEWDPSTFAFPNEFWIRKLWKCLEKNFDKCKALNKDAGFEDFLKPLETWCLIPAYSGDVHHILVQINKRNKVLYRETFAAISSLESALTKISVPYLNVQLLSEHSLMLIAPYIGRAESPISVLLCLNHYREQIRRTELSESDCCAVLAYFAENLNTMLDQENIEHAWVSASLKHLTLFVTKEGTRRSFEDDDCKVLVLPKGIPEDGLEQWASATGTVLLRNETELKNLYRFLGFTYTHHIDVYLEHILQNWNSLPDSAILAHLQYMKNRLLSSMGEDFTDKQKRMLDILRLLPVIPDANGRKRASEYTSPRHPILKMMCNEEEFPPADLRKYEWKRFLELIGLKHELSSDLYIRFAKEISAEGRFGITERSALKSRTLIKYLFLNPLEKEPWLYQEISHIKFVVPYEIDAMYTIVHSQYSDPGYFICFHKAIVSSHFKLAWSSLPLLPYWADPRRYNYKQNNQMQLLCVHNEPPVESVIKHTQNVCDSLKHLFESNRSDRRDVSLWIEPFMDTLYDFLQSKGLSSDITKQKLYSFPVVFVPEANRFVRAHQVIEDLSSDQEIRPYLFKAPPRFGKFFRLFIFLGAARYPSFMHYVKVLSFIKDEVQNNELTAEYLSEWGAIRVALENLFCLLPPPMPNTSVNTTGEIPQGTVLYLPSRERRMVNATQLMIADNGYYEQRLARDMDFEFLIDLKTLKLGYTIMSARWLPAVIRPKFLTDIVKEEVDISEMCEVQTCAKAIQLEAFMHCDDFIEAVLRILKHFKAEHQMPVSTKVETNIAQRIRNTRIKRAKGLKTYLHLNGVKIERSVEPKDCFMSKPKKESTDEQIRIYFQEEFESDFEFIQSMDECLIRYIHFVIDSKVPDYLIMRLFHKINDPSSITLMLDKIPIAPYCLPASVLRSIFPEPGAYVPVELHHLLNCDFTEFMPSDYHSVALELEDAEMFDNDETMASYMPVYIYVRIERKVRTDNEASVVCQKFEVFTGSEVVIVPAFKIYKFVRPRKSGACTDVVDASALPEPSTNQSLHEIYYSVRHRLEEAWQLQEDDRRHIIKRLYLYWHPDKNLGNEQVCSDVFRYIKDIIYKLENGISLDDSDDTDGSSRQSRANPDFTSSHYFKFCERMNNRSQSHRDQAQTFYMPDRPYSSGSAGYGTYFAHRRFCNQPYPDLGEAQRWQKQAVVDLRFAVETIDKGGDPPAYNWICYMCHQASEKSLKAAGFVRNAQNVDRHTHDIRLLSSGLPDEIHVLASSLSNLVDVHTQMRYPDRLRRPHIPSTVYTRDQAVQACELARQILELVRENFNLRV